MLPEAILEKARLHFNAKMMGSALLCLDALKRSLLVNTEEQVIPFLNDEKWPDSESDTASFIADAGYMERSEAVEILACWRALLRDYFFSERHQERAAYDPVNLGSAFHQGKLYYPVQTLMREALFSEKGGKSVHEFIDVAVVRSDRKLLDVLIQDDDRGRSTGIVRLTDGTLLQKRPSASVHATWSWGSIQNYLNGQSGRRDISSLATEVHRHLRSRVWLPDDNDYWVLTCTAICSYVQAVFEAVPLILLNGKPGTGKSELGSAMTEVSCNAVMIGQTTPQGMMRLMDEARGLVVIDDLESIGVKGGGRDKFSEMVQVLKMSYKKASATRIVTNASKRTEIMNFFGVKIVSNTSGVDAILGSRMIHISTSNLPQSELVAFLAREGLTGDEQMALRDDLHTWAFEAADDINSLYLSMVGTSAQREEEIAAPLKVIAKAIGLSEAVHSVDKSLKDQKTKKLQFSQVDDAIKYTINQWLESGNTRFSLVELVLECRRIMKPVLMKADLDSIKSESIAKRCKKLNLITPYKGKITIAGYQARVLEIDTSSSEAGPTETNRQNDLSEFCKVCATCAYRTHNCDIMPHKNRTIRRAGRLSR